MNGDASYILSSGKTTVTSQHVSDSKLYTEDKMNKVSRDSTTISVRKPPAEGDTDYCRNCGKAILRGAKFCYSCGSPLFETSPEEIKSKKEENARTSAKSPDNVKIGAERAPKEETHSNGFHTGGDL